MRHKGLCGALTEEQLVDLARTSIKQKVESSVSLSNEEQEVERYSNLLSGVIKLSKTLSDGRQQIVGLQFAPDFVGRPFADMSSVTAEAATTIELCSFPRAAVENMMREQPDFENRLLRQTLRDLDQARSLMLLLGRKTAAEKLATFLLLIAENANPLEVKRSSIEFDLPLTRTEIADFLGLTVETVSRQLTRLRTEGVIAIQKLRHITVPDLERLKARAGR